MAKQLDRSVGPAPPPLPAGLPVPVDDGAADHLAGMFVPSMRFHATDGRDLDLFDLASRLVVFVFPKMGRPDQADPPGWDAIPGARGCTQESCAYRDRYQEFLELGYEVVGLSTQSVADQAEASTRLHLPYPLLSDQERRLQAAIGLPTFSAAGLTLYKRLTFVAHDGRIAKVFYPIFPPQQNAPDVLDWIRADAPARDVGSS
jgi:peroxiredoxin